MTKIATDIPAEVFYQILDWLRANDWQLTQEYDPEIFDKGIDVDYYLFTKNDETLLMFWDIWFDGEIQATDNTLQTISLAVNYPFKFGNPVNIESKRIKRMMGEE